MPREIPNKMKCLVAQRSIKRLKSKDMLANWTHDLQEMFKRNKVKNFKHLVETAVEVYKAELEFCKSTIQIIPPEEAKFVIEQRISDTLGTMTKRLAACPAVSKARTSIVTDTKATREIVHLAAKRKALEHGFNIFENIEQAAYAAVMNPIRKK